MKILFFPSMQLLKARALKFFSADTCSCSPLYCVIEYFGGRRRLSISIQDRGKGKEG